MHTPSLRGAIGDEAIQKKKLLRPFGARNDEGVMHTAQIIMKGSPYGLDRK